jgi:hypothetical protein
MSDKRDDQVNGNGDDSLPYREDVILVKYDGGEMPVPSDNTETSIRDHLIGQGHRYVIGAKVEWSNVEYEGYRMRCIEFVKQKGTNG